MPLGWPRLALVAAIFAALAFTAWAGAISVDDSAGYLGPARAWAAGHGLREASGLPLQYRLPAYPLFLGVIVRLFGDSGRAIGLAQGACLVFAALAVRRALAPRGADVADLAAAVIVVYPPLLTSAALILQETFISLLLAVVFLAASSATARPSGSRGLAVGMALGVAALAKTTALAAWPPLVALLFGRARRGRAALLAVLGCLLVLGPWALRNHRVLGRFDLAPGNAGHTLLGGTVSNRIANWSTFPEYVAALREWKAGGQREEPVLDRYLARVALDRIREDPGRWMLLCLERLVRFMLPARTWFVQKGLDQTGSFGPIYLLATAVHVALFASTGWLAVRALRTRDATLGVGPVIVLSHMFVYALTYVSPRYAVTVGPVLVASSAIAFDEWRRGRSLDQGTAGRDA